MYFVNKIMDLVATFHFTVSSESIAEKVVKSLQSDISNTSEFFERSSIHIQAHHKTIELEIKALDIVAAKASINSCLQWLENSINILEKYSKNKNE